jgi:GT2 family glycosyltransferase
MKRHLTAGLLNINEADLTIDVMEKLARLPQPQWSVQMILVDNGSREDQVQQILNWFFKNRHRFDKVMFINAFQNLGANGGRNQILKLAEGERILILDNDVILPDDTQWLDTLWRGMDNDPGIAIIGPMLVFFDHPDTVQGTGIALTERGHVGYLNRGRPVAGISPELIEVVASPAACWLLNIKAQQEIGLFPLEYYPMQYWDVDFCLQLNQAGWKIVCDCSLQIKHIENVTTRNLKDHPYTRVAARHALQFRTKWKHILPQLATITEEDIYWGPIPRDNK